LTCPAVSSIVTGTGAEGVLVMTIWLEDLHEGQRFVGAGREITTAAIKAFAADYDPQPFHLDEAAAGASFFGGLAASGWHTASLTMRMIVEAIPRCGGVIGAGGEIRWPRPTRPGDVLHVECTIERITPSRSRPDRGMAVLRCETLNQRGELAQVLVANLIVFRRPTGGEAA
jgi:acyl dehydratase